VVAVSAGEVGRPLIARLQRTSGNPTVTLEIARLWDEPTPSNSVTSTRSPSVQPGAHTHQPGLGSNDPLPATSSGPSPAALGGGLGGGGFVILVVVGLLAYRFYRHHAATISSTAATTTGAGSGGEGGSPHDGDVVISGPNPMSAALQLPAAPASAGSVDGGGSTVGTAVAVPVPVPPPRATTPADQAVDHTATLPSSTTHAATNPVATPARALPVLSGGGGPGPTVTPRGVAVAMPTPSPHHDEPTQTPLQAIPLPSAPPAPADAGMASGVGGGAGGQDPAPPLTSVGSAGRVGVPTFARRVGASRA